jgi:hypothetical protein
MRYAAFAILRCDRCNDLMHDYDQESLCKIDRKLITANCKLISVAITAMQSQADHYGAVCNAITAN